MSTFVCDYAWARPDPHAIKAAGFVAVCRYLSHDTTGKTLTAGEVAALHSAGLGIVANFEDSAGRAHKGRQAGRDDANFANQLADQLGFPASCPIYYSVDTDPGSPISGDIQEYVRGLRDVQKRPVGVYGGDVLVKWALDNGLVAYGWWANASSWDHGVKGAGQLHQLYSHPAGTDVIPGVDGSQYDTSIVLDPNFGAWGGTSTQGALLVTQDDINLLRAETDRTIGTLQSNMKQEWIPAIVAGTIAALSPLLKPGTTSDQAAALTKAAVAEVVKRLSNG
ncbi:MAG: DUF1906 domain-containing protein [Mycobacteriaceae bacterium]